MTTGPRDRDAVGRDGDDFVDDDDEDAAANQAHAASTPTSASTARPRFIEITLTVPGGRPDAAGWLTPTVSCPFAPVLGDAQTLLGLVEAPDGEGEHRDAEREDDQDLGPDRHDPPVDR